ncbi:hypothetical protein MHM84_17595 [Halomonas sp. McH1-25]|nr:hypothetical protein [Halomonas sp. FL8]MCG7601583.1 hypothetical protein [Halomonas sp. McH1-25]MCP1343146.1 hypothetical protein [Halomonas sp. FL8]MCP1360957.1 hypothetical protein [Halomonas sp. BBD45]MCP1364697.1 hypothetical protein [Halomonas sp. BBD48]
MDLNDKKLKLLLANQFEIDCIKIELKQQKNDDQIIYCGPGSITQKPDGDFHLKLYHSFKDVTKELMPELGDSVPGKIIGKEEFLAWRQWICPAIYGQRMTSLCPMASLYLQQERLSKVELGAYIVRTREKVLLIKHQVSFS